MDAYTDFAGVYDEFMEDVPYDTWLELVLLQLRNEGITDGLILDLGCGTGTFTRMLAEAGYDMIGVDGSEEMLSVAREHPDDGILYLCQDMRSFELYGTVRAVVSTCDTMNYLLTPEDFVQTLRLVNNYLDPGGIFIFDVNTLYRFREVMGNTTIAENQDHASFIWENYFDEDTGRNEYDLTLFIRQENGLFARTLEVHEEQGYTYERICAMIRESGMEYVTSFDAADGGAVRENSEKIFFVAREHGKGMEKI